MKSDHLTSNARTLKLATRIGIGFGGVIAISVLLGLVAVWNMRSSTQRANTLAREEVPQVVVANNVERSSLQTMLEIRSYGLSEETNFLALGMSHLGEVKKHLKEAIDLGSSSTSLAALKTAAETASTKVSDYERLVQETVQKTATIDQVRAQMDTSAKGFMAACNGFVKGQNESMAKDIAAKAGADELTERFKKVTLANDIIEAGNAIRLIAWRAQAERDVKRIDEAAALFATIDQKLNELRPITKQAANIQQIADCKAAATAYSTALNELSKNWVERDGIATRRNVAANAVLAEARGVSDNGLKDARTLAEETSGKLSFASFMLTVGLVAAILVSVAIAYFLTRAITRPIKSVADSITAGSEQTASAASHVSEAGQSLAEGASEQAASLEETSSSLEEMSSMTKKNADNAQKANQLAREAREAADRGAQDMAEMTRAMEGIKTSSDDIAKIIKTIDEIAFQTNILALNAAVEAARAGEAGMGFAVVADEVRALAQRSAQAAKETSAKIEGAIGRTTQGVEISHKVAEALQQIVVNARAVDELVGEVSSASREQSQGIEQLNLAVGQMDKVVQSNAANAEESASAAEELSAQANALQEAAAELRLLVDGTTARHGGSPSDNGHAKPAKTSRTVMGLPKGNDGRLRPAPIKTLGGRDLGAAPAAAAGTKTAEPMVAPSRQTTPSAGDRKSVV